MHGFIITLHVEFFENVPFKCKLFYDHLLYNLDKAMERSKCISKPLLNSLIVIDQSVLLQVIVLKKGGGWAED